MSAKVAGNVADMRSTADVLDRKAGDLAQIAARTGAGAVNGALLGSIAFSPFTGASAEKNIVEAAAGPARIALKIKALAVLLRAKATLFEAADNEVFKTFTHHVGQYYAGIWDGVKGMGEGVVLLAKLSTTRMLLDPKGWFKDVSAIAKGLHHGVTHPVEFLKAMTDWETWKTNPARAFGRLVPDIILAVTTAGAGTSATAVSRSTKAAKVAADLAEAARAADKLKKLPDAPRVDRIPDGPGVDKTPDGPRARPEGDRPLPPDVLERPSWRQSERDVGERLGPDYSEQESFLGGEPVPGGRTGSVRPDWYGRGEAVEVKNYDVQTPKGRSRLVDTLAEQIEARAQNLPPGTKQRVFIDVRGQKLSIEDAEALVDRIVARSNGVLKPEDIDIFRS